MEDQADSPVSRRGELHGRLSPTPSWPESLRPQQYRTPSFLMAHVWAAPAATIAHDDEVPTRTGHVRFVLSPTPSWPSALKPQHQSVPLVLMPHVCQPPVETCVHCEAAAEAGIATYALTASPPAAIALRVDPDAPAADDPYSDPKFQVPDDLVW